MARLGGRIREGREVTRLERIEGYGSGKVREDRGQLSGNVREKNTSDKGRDKKGRVATVEIREGRKGKG